MTFKNFYYRNKSNKQQIFEDVFETYYDKGYFGKLNKSTIKEQQIEWFKKFLVILDEGDKSLINNILANRDNLVTRELFSRIYKEDILEKSRKEIEDSVNKVIIVKKISESYIGSCVDVGNDTGEPICDIFSDATEMSSKVYDPEEDDNNDSIEIKKEDFLKYINLTNSDMVKGKVKYFYIGTSKNIEQAKIFYVYNFPKDIHYFFKKDNV